jgi:PHP family Zn ribbon phosphoesterase
MTRTTCPDCRLRFTAAMAATLPSCPSCGGPLAVIAGQHSLGYRLADPIAPLADLPIARAASLLPPPPARDRS